jgi:hypothetical protein
LQAGCGKLQSFHRAQHRDRRCDHCVTVQYGGAQQSEQNQNATDPPGLLPVRSEQSKQGKDAAFAAIICAQHVDHVLERNYREQRPEYERENTEDVVSRDWNGMLTGETFAQGVNRAGADVPVDYPEYRYGQNSE